VWILVEGETDETVIQEIARILGKDLFGCGICCFKFTELGAAPFLKLADQFGIHWILVADADTAGNNYIQAGRALLAGRQEAEHIWQLPAWDIETYLSINGYGHIYEATISQQLQSQHPTAFKHGTNDYWKHVVTKLQPKSGKPERVSTVIDAIELAGPPGMPQYLRDLIEHAIAKSVENGN
jgi:predicted ATP-dependent endonuclease of OLD family